MATWLALVHFAYSVSQILTGSQPSRAWVGQELKAQPRLDLRHPGQKVTQAE